MVLLFSFLHQNESQNKSGLTNQAAFTGKIISKAQMFKGI
jgi:hypothetical protein